MKTWLLGADVRGLLLIFLFLMAIALTVAQAQESTLRGRVLDPQGRVLAGAKVELLVHETNQNQMQVQAVSAADGSFQVSVPSAGDYLLRVTAEGFRPVSLIVILHSGINEPIQVQMKELAATNESVMVSANVNAGDILSPDPAMKVFATEDLLDANPGRPGAPISIPGYPVETASSGIKAPQYFAPGVAGDHGEPIAQYVQVGAYLVPNNLSANAHGNGYADPNIYIANAIQSVQVDGGAFNVREGNHALNLAAIYGLRSHIEPFVTLTADYRDITATAGMSPMESSWIAMEGSYGNGFLDRLEHRKQFKLNGGRVFQLGNHTLNLFGIAYYGVGFMAGLQPIYGFNSIDAAAGWVVFPDTIDSRQRDQTHTALLALNDHWKLNEKQSLDLSGFFRTYNLALDSDFGLGLIRQSEFRTVSGANANYVKRFSGSFTLLAGTDFECEAPRRDNLDHYNFFNAAEPYSYGPFVKIDGNNVTITSVTPYAAGQGQLGKHLTYYLGWRRDEIEIKNQDLINSANSSSKLVGLNSPKMTFTFLPAELRALPLISFSFGKSFFTEDPRMGTPLNGPTAPDPVETARSYQLVVSKIFRSTEAKLTLGHETQSAEFGKIDPDQGLQFDLGPGRIRYLAATLQQRLPNGALQVTLEEADARLLDVTTSSITPEAPRLIGDVTGTYQKLPFHIQVKGEFEYVGRKVVGTSCDASQPLTGGTGYCVGVPNKEFRLALARTFMNGRLGLGLNAMLASGWTGQTTENFAAASVYGPGLVGLGANGLVPANPVSEVVGVRIPSYASLNLTYHFDVRLRK